MPADKLCERCAMPSCFELGQLIHATVNAFTGWWHFQCLSRERAEVARLAKGPTHPQARR
jgi:hypothetical protein